MDVLTGPDTSTVAPAVPVPAKKVAAKKVAARKEAPAPADDDMSALDALIGEGSTE
jgi:hypothetical protein